jgi:5-formyltetrahydrofolate cyclo-ligase
MSQEKVALRKLLRARFPGEAQRNEESCRMCELIASSVLFRDVSVIAGYMPLPWEADITKLMSFALLRKKTLLLPRVESPHVMTMRKVVSMSDLITGSYGILEPSQDAPIIPCDDIELLLTPLEGIDKEGIRLGKGGGFYDTLLPSMKGISLGCALSWQWIEHIPADPWDVKLDACADSRRIHWFTDQPKEEEQS